MTVLANLPIDKLRIVLVIFLVAFNVLFWFVLKPIDNHLVKLQETQRPQPVDPKWRAYNTFHLQMFFWYHFDTKEILKQWGEEGRRLARRSLLFDFALMPTYAFCFAAFYLLMAATTTDGWRTTFVWLALCPFIAWICDVVENVMELLLLDTAQNAEPSMVLLTVAGIATACKWTLIFVPLIVGGIIWLWLRFRDM